MTNLRGNLTYQLYNPLLWIQNTALRDRTKCWRIIGREIISTQEAGLSAFLNRLFPSPFHPRLPKASFSNEPHSQTAIFEWWCSIPIPSHLSFLVDHQVCLGNALHSDTTWTGKDASSSLLWIGTSWFEPWEISCWVFDVWRLLYLCNCRPKNAIAPMSKTPRGNPTPNPIAKGLSDVVPCVRDGVRVVKVVGEVVCVFDGRGVLNWVVSVVGKEVVVDTGRHILTAVFAT